jgi:hypothetical protein
MPNLKCFTRDNYESNCQNCITEKSCFLMNFEIPYIQFINLNFLIMLNSGSRSEEKYPYSTEKTNGSVNMSGASEQGGIVKPYNEWTKEELYQLARKVGIPGRSYMNKKNLVTSLRNIKN